jgi:4-hydroxy-tetrahydrodipicolinate synthase
MRQIFNGIWVPIVTPFLDDDIDHSALARLAQYFSSQGIAGLVAGATTGEGALLAPGEIEEIFVTLREAVPDLPVVLGLSQASTQTAVRHARELATLKPEGLLVTAPVYVRPTQQGIQRHFEAIVEAADLPTLIYNIPYRSAVNVELETVQALARDTRVVGIKECGGSMDRMLRLVHETPLQILSGDDNQNFTALCLGAHGTIAASAHILPSWHTRIYKSVCNGHVAEARRIAVALQPLIRALFAEPNPAPLKALLAQQGWCAATVRLPFIAAGEELVKCIMTEWASLQKIDALDAESIAQSVLMT